MTKRRPYRPIAAALNSLASIFIGDDGKPDMFFVTWRGSVVTITADAPLAYRHWLQLAQYRPLTECALENRSVGVLASVEPLSETDATLVVHDDSRMCKALR